MKVAEFGGLFVELYLHMSSVTSHWHESIDIDTSRASDNFILTFAINSTKCIGFQLPSSLFHMLNGNDGNWKPTYLEGTRLGEIVFLLTLQVKKFFTVLPYIKNDGIPIILLYHQWFYSPVMTWKWSTIAFFEDVFSTS